MKYETKHLSVTFSANGKIEALIDKTEGQDYLAKGRESRFGILHREGKEEFATLQSKANLLIATFPKNDLEVTFEVESGDEYLVFKLLEVNKHDFDRIELLKLSLSITERPAVYLNGCHNQKFLLAVMPLTLEVNSFFPEKSSESSTFGVECYPKFGLRGTQFAIIGCSPDKFLRIADKIQARFALPRCVKALRSDSVNKSYFFIGSEVKENDSEEIIAYAKQGCFKTVMLAVWNWCSTQGHYQINRKYFPEGIISLKRFVDKLHQAGLGVGLHNAAACIRLKDPYVTPLPSPYLYAQGMHILAEDIGERNKTIPLISEHPESLTRDIKSALNVNNEEAQATGMNNVVRIDNELIKFSQVSGSSGWKLVKCERGFYNTRPASHKKGAIVYHLMQLFANLFTPASGTPLWDEVAQGLADVVNFCNFDFVYADYAERSQGWVPGDSTTALEKGNWYFTAKFLKNLYDRIENEDILFQTSLWLAGSGYSWHLSPRTCFMNGGKDIKKAVDEKIPVVSVEAENNFKKLEIGWCRILDPSWYSVDEIEYVCQKAIGYDAAISLYTLSLDVLKQKSDTKEIFATIAKYRKLQENNKFSEDEKETFRCSETNRKK